MRDWLRQPVLNLVSKLNDSDFNACQSHNAEHHLGIDCLGLHVVTDTSFDSNTRAQLPLCNLHVLSQNLSHLYVTVLQPCSS